jgi:hypothetical protein
MKDKEKRAASSGAFFTRFTSLTKVAGCNAGQRVLVILPCLAKQASSRRGQPAVDRNDRTTDEAAGP